MMGRAVRVPFVQGSATSEAAAHAKEDTQLRDEERIMRLLVRAGDDGMTDAELEQALGGRQSGVSARRRGLVLKRRVCDSGRTRYTPSNRQAVVWIIGVEVHPLIGAPNARPKRPSPAEIRAAVEEIKRYVAHGRKTGAGEPCEALQTLGEWIVDIA